MKTGITIQRNDISRQTGRLPCIILLVTAHSHRGKFITFEGLDGCGKSTQLKKLAAALRAQGVNVVETREPGGTQTAEKIRELLLNSKTSPLAPNTELALMFAARVQHIDCPGDCRRKGGTL
jgi:thymidylate kinase